MVVLFPLILQMAFPQMRVLIRTQLNTQWEPSRLPGSPLCPALSFLLPSLAAPVNLVSLCSQFCLNSGWPQALPDPCTLAWNLWTGKLWGLPWASPQETDHCPSSSGVQCLENHSASRGTRVGGGESSWGRSAWSRATWTWEWGVWSRGQHCCLIFLRTRPTPPQLRWICSIKN